MSAGRIAVGFVGLAACAPDIGANVVERCAVLTDLLVVDDDRAAVLPANTHGDDARELWIVHETGRHDGFVRQPDGSYKPTWQFDMSGAHGFHDFDRDGLDDPFIATFPAWSYRRMRPEGTPEAAATDLRVSPDEFVGLWGDFDEDGVSDRIGLFDHGLHLTTGAGAITSVMTDVHGPVLVHPVIGDPRGFIVIAGVEGSETEEVIALHRLADDGAVQTIWGPHEGTWGWARAAVVGQRTDLFLTTDVTHEVTHVQIEDGSVEQRTVQRDVVGVRVADFDGDGNVDLMITKDTTSYLHFAGEDGVLGPGQAVPEEEIPVYARGAEETFDLDADGAAEVLLRVPRPDGGARVQSLQYERCE